MTFIRKKLDGADFSNADLGVTFLLKTGFEDDYDGIVEFKEMDDIYKVKVYDWYEIRKDIVEEYRFHEGGIECWECDGYCSMSKKVVGNGTYYKGTAQEFDRSWDFCSQDCLNKYVNNIENKFTLK